MGLRSAGAASGFTLLELLLVLAILTLVVTILAPSLRGFGIGRGNNNTATQIVSLANYARTQAVSESRRYRLNIDASARAYWLTVEDGGTFVAPANDFGKRYEAADGVQIQTDLTQQTDGVFVEFEPSGRTDPARITLTDKLGNKIEIACLSATELFRILPPEEMTQ